MEWYWCWTDGNCWAAWFWSPATAAFLQVFVAGYAMIYAGNRSKKTMDDVKELIRNKINLDSIKNISRIAVALNLISTRMGEFLNRVDKEKTISEVDIRAQVRILARADETLRETLFHELPNKQIIRDVIAVRDAVLTAIHGYEEILEGNLGPSVEPYRSIQSEVRLYEDRLDKFLKAYAEDNTVTWKDVHPDGGGFAHGRDDKTFTDQERAAS